MWEPLAWPDYIVKGRTLSVTVHEVQKYCTVIKRPSNSQPRRAYYSMGFTSIAYSWGCARQERLATANSLIWEVRTGADRQAVGSEPITQFVIRSLQLVTNRRHRIGHRGAQEAITDDV